MAAVSSLTEALLRSGGQTFSLCSLHPAAGLFWRSRVLPEWELIRTPSFFFGDDSQDPVRTILEDRRQTTESPFPKWRGGHGKFQELSLDYLKSHICVSIVHACVHTCTNKCRPTPVMHRTEPNPEPKQYQPQNPKPKCSKTSKLYAHKS